MIKIGFNAPSRAITRCFYGPPSCPLWRLGFLSSSSVHPKIIQVKRNLFCINQRSNTHPHIYQANAQPFNQFMFHG